MSVLSVRNVGGSASGRVAIEAAAGREFLQATLDSLSAHIAVLDDQGEVMLINRAWRAFSAANGGASDGEGGNYLAVCDAAAENSWALAAAAGLRAILSGDEEAFELEYPCHSPDAERWFELRAARFHGSGTARAVVAHDEVTERRQAEAEVSTQAALLDEVDVAVMATDPAGRITHWNRGAERLFGWTLAEAAGRLMEEVTASAEGEAEIVEDALLRHGHWTGEQTVTRKDGASAPAYLRVRETVDVDGAPTGRTGVAVDISDRVAGERALLAGRNYMQAVADSIGEGLFTLDTQGHVIYMNAAAEQLLGWSLETLAGRVLHHVTHTRRLDGTPLPIDDCPILAARRDGRTVRVDDDVFTRRDGTDLPVAYTASPFETADGVKGCVVVFEDISDRKAREDVLLLQAGKFAWIGRIQDALATDRFVLYSQPIVDLRCGETVQRELLLRMREPDGAIVGPGEFLEVAEQYGLIGEIDRWVIERGVDIAAMTGSAVELNLSARSIGDPAMLQHIERCIGQSGADPELIVIEITETAILEDAEAARAFASRLRQIGCKLALDDFGTGYGGFTYLKQLPVDYLKIDIEFVRDLVTNPGSRHVVEAVVALARGFGLHTVAEGVEDAGTLELLHRLDVDFAQGYHIARPAPLDRLTGDS